MSITLYDATIPGYVRMLGNLSAIMDKAEAHAAETGADLSTYMEARLAEDMRPFPAQIQMASDAAKGGAARLSGQTPPSFPDDEATWGELKARIAKTIAFVESVKPEAVNGDDDRIIELPLPNRTLTFTTRDFALNFSVPNFLFHVTTAYALLRMKGVPLGKPDFLAGAVKP